MNGNETLNNMISKEKNWWEIELKFRYFRLQKKCEGTNTNAKEVSEYKV